MYRRSGIVAVIFLAAAVFAGCRSSITGNNNEYEYNENFAIGRTVAGGNAISISNVNGSVTVAGRDGLTEIQITGKKTVEAGSYDEARSHISDITIDTLTMQNEFSVTTTQPNSSSGLTYRVDYDVVVPKSWKVAVTDVNGTVSVTDINGGVGVYLTNGLFDADGINGNVAANLTNGNIAAKVTLPDSGDCELRTLNGNIILSVPGTTSATVSASVVNGAVGVSNLTVVASSSSLTHFTGTIGSGSGRIVLSTLNGTIQLTRL